MTDELIDKLAKVILDTSQKSLIEAPCCSQHIVIWDNLSESSKVHYRHQAIIIKQEMEKYND